MVQNNTYCVYRHIDLDTMMPFYVGLGIDLKRPYYTFGRNQKWNEIVANGNYRVDILFENLSKEEARLKEKEFILIYGRKDIGTGCLVNKNSGGQGGNIVKWTPELRKKQSELSKGRFHTESAKKRQSEKQKGKIVPKERIEKMLKTRSITGWEMKESTKKKISEKRIGFVYTDEIKIKIASRRKTKKYIQNTPKKYTPSKYYVFQIDIITKEVICRFDSINEAGRLTFINPKNISRVLNGQAQSSKGFGWRKELKENGTSHI